jgi:hypothetical protein
MKDNGRGNSGKRRGVRRSRTAHNAAPSGTVEEVAAQLAPLEEQEAAGRARSNEGDNNGAIVVDTGTLNLPEGLVEEKKKRDRLLGIEPVVAFIIALALAFIIFIAWEISRMPPPTG